MIIGIDLSLNSTGVCLFDEVSGKYQFAANINLCSYSSRKVTPSLEEYLADAPPMSAKSLAKLAKKGLAPKPQKKNWVKMLSELPDFMLDGHKRETGQGEGHVEIGHLRLFNVDLLTKEFHRTIVKAQEKFRAIDTSSKTIIAFEDYSIANITEAIVIVIETTAHLKQQYLLPELESYKDMYLIPGPKLKMLAGSGNFDKFQMLMAFVDIKDPAVTSTPFYQFVRENLNDIVSRNGKKVIVSGPISDVIDAFWVVKYTKDIILDGGVIEKKPKLKASKAKKI